MKPKHFFLLVFAGIFSSQLTFAQAKLDSALNRLAHQKNNQFVSTLKHLYEEDFIRQLDDVKDSLPEFKKKLNNKILAFAKKQEPSQQVLIYAFMANQYIRNLNIYQGYSLLQKAASLLDKKPTYSKIYYYQQYANVMATLQRPDSCFYYSDKSLETAYLMGNDSIILSALQPLAQKVYVFEQYEKAIYYFRLLAEHPLATDLMKRSANHQLGMSYFKLKQYDLARNYFQKSLSYSEKMNDTIWIGLDNGNIGHSYFLEGKYDQALPFLLMDLRFSSLHGMTTSAMNCLNILVKLSIYSNKATQAGLYFERLQVAFKEIELKSDALNDQKLKFFETATLYHEFIREHATALLYSKQYIDLLKEIDRRDAIKNARLMEAWANFDQLTREVEGKAQELLFKEQRILLLEKEKMLQEAENNRKTNLLIGAIALILLICGILYAIYHQYKMKKEANQALEKQRDEIGRKNQELSESLSIVEKHQKRLEKLAEHLSEVNATKDKLFSIIGHDLRAPIANLKSLVEMLSSQRISQEDFVEISASLSQSIEHVFFTLDNLLQWANSQLQGFQTEPQAVDLHKVAQENVDFLIVAAQSKEIVLSNQISKDFLVNVDKNQISLVFRNLINNAIKFTPKFGKVSLSAFLEEQKLKIAIADTGVGMSEENLDKLFKHNVHYSTYGTAGEKGTGLGLLLCEEMISRHGGEISVRSKLGEGTTFWITLPRFASTRN